MTLPALPDLSTPQDELAAVRARLIAVRASLQKACQELDAQIQALDELSQSAPRDVSVPNLFETEPVPPVSEAPPPEVSWHEEPTTHIVMEATAPTSLDPALEQATLEELNTALSKAFAQISGRHQWAG
ncbi:hypothetical protein [Prosthecobacter dejongeii]|uniref:Uncharacterized protein n=1 Tax=Prosthecobacter dejongeii TaxID=48465 RepID=A0A7W7YP57_9BACT|nr:hypothetical protein [Prosthecobacter dejongeii]MBB5039570.1 hypothetical protein [Prosthecobacter dejongeii]